MRTLYTSILAFSLFGCSYVDPMRASDELFLASLVEGAEFEAFQERNDEFAVESGSPQSSWTVMQDEIESACNVEFACTPDDLVSRLEFDTTHEGSIVAKYRVINYTRFVGTWATREIWLFFNAEDELIGWAKVRW